MKQRKRRFTCRQIMVLQMLLLTLNPSNPKSIIDICPVVDDLPLFEPIQIEAMTESTSD